MVGTAAVGVAKIAATSRAVTFLVVIGPPQALMDCDSSFELSPLLGSIRQLASRFERNAFLLRLSVDGLEAPPHLGSNQPRRHVLLREAIEFAYVLAGPRLALIGWFLGHMPFLLARIS